MVVCTNRKVGFEYEILERFTAGLILKGSEVKSLRIGSANIQDSYVVFKDGRPHLINAYIAPYPFSRESPDPRRSRELLLRRHEIDYLIGKVRIKGLTLVPLKIFFRGKWAKVEIALARGRKLHDKREAIRRREAKREIERAIKELERGKR